MEIPLLSVSGVKRSSNTKSIYKVSVEFKLHKTCFKLTVEDEKGMKQEGGYKQSVSDG